MLKNFRKLCARPQDAPSCAQYAVFGIFPKSRYRQTCWVNSIHLLIMSFSIFHQFHHSNTVQLSVLTSHMNYILHERHEHSKVTSEPLSQWRNPSIDVTLLRIQLERCSNTLAMSELVEALQVFLLMVLEWYEKNGFNGMTGTLYESLINWYFLTIHLCKMSPDIVLMGLGWSHPWFCPSCTRNHELEPLSHL